MKTNTWRLNNDIASNVLNEGIRRDHPLQTTNKSKIISRSKNDYIKFGHSSLKTDSAQTAVPFWDAQPVTLVPAVPLVGAGFYFKSSGNSGGFIAPIILAARGEVVVKEINSVEMEDMVANYQENWLKSIN